MTAAPDPKRPACPNRVECADCNCDFKHGFLAGRAHGLEQAAQWLERDSGTTPDQRIYAASRIRALAKETE